MTKLNRRKIEWIIRWKKRGKSSKNIAIAQKVTKRRINQLYSSYKKTGEIPVLNHNRRPRKELTDEEKQIIEESYKETYLGAKLLRYHIKFHYRVDINHNRIHKYLLERKLAEKDPKKQNKRKRCRYERKHSCSLIHGDWTEWNGKQIIGFIDDASRKMLSLGEFDEATGKNTLDTFKKAEKSVEEYNAIILEVNTDRGTQFYTNKREKKKGIKGISEFEKYLDNGEIKHIPSRVNNPQTNGKFERWVREYKKHRNKFNSAEEFMEWYNDRLHGALNLEWAETPNQAFIRKLRPESLLGLFFKNVVGKG